MLKGVADCKQALQAGSLARRAHHDSGPALMGSLSWCPQEGFGPANTSLAFHNKQLLALVEVDQPYVVR